jgi:hypothetical protein
MNYKAWASWFSVLLFVTTWSTVYFSDKYDAACSEAYIKHVELKICGDKK